MLLGKLSPLKSHKLCMFPRRQIGKYCNKKVFLGNNVEVQGQASVTLITGLCCCTKVFYSVNNNVELKA